MQDKILFFRSRVLSYSSEEIFLNCMIRDFEKAGFLVEVRLLGPIQEEEELLRSYLGKKYRAIIDINSTLPVVTIDGEYLLDLIDAPFYQLILDHPMHLHERLQVPLKNYHVVCVDKEHASYVREHYPHVKSVQVMHYPGIKAKDYIPFEKRSYSLLFPATYAPLTFFQEKLKKISIKQWILTEEILEEMKAGYSFGQSQKRVLEQRMLPKQTELSSFAFSERYIRAYQRERLVEMLLEEEIPLTVCGLNWDLHPMASHPALQWLGSCSYEKVVELEADSKAVLNLQPLFAEGLHDRGANAFANGSLLITDGCDFLEQHLKEGYLTYDFWDQEGYSKIKEALREEAQAYQMAERGRNIWESLGLDWTFSLE